MDGNSYLNGGKWYVLLDEAHRGGKESLRQGYAKLLTQNGFLFNFSATFTEELDYATTCFNFNLEKFITSGYGKNLYLNNSYFNFNNTKDFNKNEKQKQVLKFLLMFTLIKLQKTKPAVYHDPMMITLVNSIHTEKSDLKLYFIEIANIAAGEVDNVLFEEAREELKNDFSIKKFFVYGKEQLPDNITIKIKDISLEQVMLAIFNSTQTGKIEIVEGESGKEIGLKLETSDSLFGLIKIGDAKKFVLQAIGRGLRIQPMGDKRKRLPSDDTNKNKILETLFLFATDKSSIEAITETVKAQQNLDDWKELSLENNDKFV